MRTVKNSSLYWAIAGAALLVGAAGCAAHQNAALERARASYEAAQRSPEVLQYAQPELTTAGSTLSQAEVAFERDQEKAEVDHLALMSEKQSDIARAQASARAASSQNRVLLQQRDQIAEAQRTELEIRLAELQARETERGLVVTLGDVLFETDRADLRPSAR